MREADIPAVGRLFYKAFRDVDREPSEDFQAYFKACFFDCPFYDENAATIVHERSDGHIDAAVLALPMQMMAWGRPFTGRLMSAYMADQDSRSGGAARLVLTVRPRQQEFCFSDTASKESADHIHAIGGQVLPVQSLEWRRLFRPLAHYARWLERRVLPKRPLGLARLMVPFDALLREAVRPLRAASSASLKVTNLSENMFLDIAGDFLAHFAIRPAWSRPELTWLLEMAHQKTDAGPLNIRAVVDATGDILGCFVYYGGPKMPAQVLNILSQPGREGDVVKGMLAYLDGMGCISAAGMGQPFLIDAFDQASGVIYRHRSYFWVSTRHEDMRAAIDAGDFYAGGLASEAWSRLLTDFN